MKVLPDESVPRRLASFFPEPLTLRTVQEMGWAGTPNGLLLSRAAAENFKALVTVDRGIEHQQNISALPISIIIMLAPRNRLAELQPLVPKVVSLLSVCLEKRIYHVT
ncbi:MAG: hypothetical protein OXU19_07425 [bacterium]|nr:hypothetical protein [bacterium]MDE0238717.1 hypothetical protein [bacterium]MDE0418734.1 hypothetical protein [bacterium]